MENLEVISKSKLWVKLSLFSFVLFIVGSVFFYYPRTHLNPIFDETGVIQYVINLIKAHDVHSAAALIKSELSNIFYEPQNHQPIARPLQVLYRPLQVITVLYKVGQFYYFSYHPNILILLNACIAASSALCLFLLLFRLIRNEWVALGGAFLMLFSIPTLTGTWVVASGEHALVPLFVAVTLLCYTQFRKLASKQRIGWGVLTFLLCLIIPLYKEYGSVATFIIVAHEILFFKKKNLWFFLLMLVATFNAFFTSFFINLIFYHNVVFHSAANKAHVSISEMLFNPELSSVSRFIFSIPPLVSGLGLLGFMLKIKNSLPNFKYKFVGVFVTYIVLGAGWVLSFCLPTLPIIKLLPLVMLFSLFLAGFVIQPLLGIWAFLSWLPFLSTLSVDVYLLYAIAPMAGICLYYACYLLKQVKESRWLTYLLQGLLLVAFADQALNMVAVYRTFQETNRAALTMSDAIAHTATKPVILLTNTLLGDDISYFLYQNHNISLKNKGFTFTKSVSPSEDYSEANKFFAFIKTNKKNSNLFVLDNFWPNSNSLMSQFLNQNKFEKKLITRYDSAAIYPYVDPLKFFIPLRYINFPGTPDLGSHMGLFNKLFYREVEVNYLLYLVDGV